MIVDFRISDVQAAAVKLFKDEGIKTAADRDAWVDLAETPGEKMIRAVLAAGLVFDDSEGAGRPGIPTEHRVQLAARPARRR